MNRDGYIVQARSRAVITASADSIRTQLQRVVGDSPFVPLDRIFEVLPELLEGFSLESCERDELGADHGQTDPDRLLIKLRVDVYDGMCRGVGRDRFTAAHELGHLFLHRGEARFARRTDAHVPIYRNSEWQADTFASAFLIDGQRLAKCRSVTEVQEVFGVSEAAARARFRSRA